MRAVLILAIAGALLVSAPLGCASSRTTTVRTEERVERPAAIAETTTSSTTVTQTPEEPRGVLSTTVHFLGEVISWPFRMVGALVRALF